MYDSLKAVMQGRESARDLPANWKNLQGINSYMLRFLENHDEQRIASEGFAGNARKAIPAMVVSATINSGPVMLYFGQEVGEPGKGKAGFSGEDGRSTIFDYWGVPEHQKWMNGGKFDGALLSEEQKKLREFYNKLLILSTSNGAIRAGKLYDLQAANSQNSQYGSDKVYAYLRFTDKQKLLIVVNFDPDQTREIRLKIPRNAFQAMQLATDKSYVLKDLLLTTKEIGFEAAQSLDSPEADAGIPIPIPPLGAYMFSINPR
jgi:glycosidase